jgi:chromosomal replication initiator protein
VPEDPETTWQSVRRELQERVTDFAFHIWLDPLRLAGCVGDTLFVAAPDHVRTLVGERYLPLLEAAAGHVLATRVHVELVGPAWTTPDSACEAAPRGHQGERLNPKYTFGQFVIGEGNRLAHAAALAVAEMPAQTYNPLFIHGRPGLGKTHLLHAIGNYVQEHGAPLRVQYATVESFTSEFVDALRRRDTGAFKERFREADVLLIDDVQFIADKARTKEEFFHTFNALYESGRQLVITSDRSPTDMADFETRLKERFGCGLVADLQAPEFDVRMAILRKRARHDRVHELDDVTLAEIARRVTASVRELEAALIRVVAWASLRGELPSPQMARGVLDRLELTCATSPSVERIQEVTAYVCGVPLDSLLARDRRPNVVFARQVAMHLARELTGDTLPSIGRRFGRNHATVLHACRRVQEDLQADLNTQRVVNAIRRRLSDVEVQ